ncbi:MAG TPA: hypothetical protein DCF68_05460 [Cyanothece sp. UBA12306]|nr:hypothetical protein [Cyanothece sp. UBA12306]
MNYLELPVLLGVASKKQEILTKKAKQIELFIPHLLLRILLIKKIGSKTRPFKANSFWGVA